jgi:CHAD domain-containing protein
MAAWGRISEARRRVERALARAARDPNARIAAAVVAGAGAVAVATKAIRARRRTVELDGGSRAYRLRRKESAADGVRRIAAGCADDALDQLRDGVPEDFATAIHEARKDLKKLRSVLRLVRPSLGDQVYRRENERFRDSGRLLSGARDAEVKLETLRALRARFADRLSEVSLAPLVAALEAERDRHLGRDGAGDPIERAVADIGSGRAAIAEWPLDGDDWSLIEPGLKRSYGRGRNRFADVRAGATDEAIHEWRKRVKDLWYQLRIVRDSKPKEVGNAADQARELSDLLGEHHDLAVLRDDVLARREPLASGELERLLASIAARQDELTEEAIVLGKQVYAEKPKAFTKRLRAYWREWR